MSAVKRNGITVITKFVLSPPFLSDVASRFPPGVCFDPGSPPFSLHVVEILAHVRRGKVAACHFRAKRDVSCGVRPLPKALELFASGRARPPPRVALTPLGQGGFG